MAKKQKAKGHPVDPHAAIKDAQEMITNQSLREEAFHSAGNTLSDSSRFIANVDCPKLRAQLQEAHDNLQAQFAAVLFDRSKRRQAAFRGEHILTSDKGIPF